MKHTIKLLTVVITLAAILTLTGCPGPVNPDKPCTHENKKSVIETAATCTETGLEKIICDDCDELIEENIIEALGHDFNEWTEKKEVNCTVDGEETRTCKREGCKHFETRTIKAHHSWELESDTTTCTENGVKTYKCSRCDETRTEDSTAGHSYGNWTVTKDATCTTDGTKKRVCSRCGETETVEIDALGHNFGEWTVTTEANCTEKGSKKHTCTRCGHEEHEEIETIPAHHTFIAGGCDKCGAYEYNGEDDYQIMAYVYSSEDDALNNENERVLYFSFPKDTTGIPQIVTDGLDGYLFITIDDLIQMKNEYIGKTVKYFDFAGYNDFLNNIESKTEHLREDLILLTSLKRIYIVIE